MSQHLLEKGNQSSEFSLARIGIASGIGLQVLSDTLNKIKTNELTTKEIVAMTTSNVSPDSIIKLADHIKTTGDSYLGAIITVVLTCVYVAKRAILKYFELKGTIAIEIAKIQVEVERIKAGKTEGVDFERTNN